jgi:anthranilate phosphoribosyltransferase
LSGTVNGARRDVVILNAAAALVAGGRAQTLHEGIRLANQSLDSGAAQRALDHLIEFSHSASS